jgi:hypothetical protein
MLFIEFIGYKWYLNNSNSSNKQKNTSGGKNVTKKGGHFCDIYKEQTKQI